MLAVVYLALIVVLGDELCRRFLRPVSRPHRFAAAMLSGLLVGSWLTYLCALPFAPAERPLLWGNLLFFLIASGLVLWLKRRVRRAPPGDAASPAVPSRAERWDWVVIGLCAAFASWLMFSTFNMKAGQVQIGNHQLSDFGPNVSLMQSFARGHNFPTEYTHYSGERIRYHFLVYFQAGNLEYLGLNPAWANNLPSVLSQVAMLALVMTLGLVLFDSRAVGRIGAALFFFHGSLAYIPFFGSHESVPAALRAAAGRTEFLPSGYDYRGEDWGVWSQVVYVNQRHFASAIGILLVVLVFLVERSRVRLAGERAELPSPAAGDTGGYLFCGALLGLLPLWNGAVFVAGFAVLGFLFFLFPAKKQMVALAMTTAAVALPQIIYLRGGNPAAPGYSLLYWGYTIPDATLASALAYLGFTFGFKWPPIAVALRFSTRVQRRVLLAVSSLIAVAFLFRFSAEVLTNHKFLNLWLVVANLFAAAGLWRLWRARVVGSAAPGKFLAVALVALIAIGGVIDLLPIRNGYWVEIPYQDDPLIRWLEQHTDPKAIFLTDTFGTHRILLAGRRIFYGWQYYAWSVGYRTAERDAIYKRLFEERDLEQLLRLLQQNNISYVAIDDGVRKRGFVQDLNEAVYQDNFERVFEDTTYRYDGLVIFRIPAPGRYRPLRPRPPAAGAPPSGDAPGQQVNAFAGGRGKGRGQFEGPRGIALDAAGNLYVADTGNARIQKFSPAGDFLAVFGRPGVGQGQLREPNGIAVDGAGTIYVTDALNHRLLEFAADGTFRAQWGGPDPGFYGPRDVAIGPDGRLYVVDQGRTRVVKLRPDGRAVGAWGKSGAGEGQFSDPTGLAVTGDRIYVADARNDRIQVLDRVGRFLRQWPVPEWKEHVWHYPDIVLDAQTQRLYVTSGPTNEVLVFDPDGKRLGAMTPAPPTRLDGPSALVLGEVEGRKLLYVLNTGGARVTAIDLGAAGVGESTTPSP